jgi:hypothetical protein
MEQESKDSCHLPIDKVEPASFHHVALPYPGLTAFGFSQQQVNKSSECTYFFRASCTGAHGTAVPLSCPELTDALTLHFPLIKVMSFLLGLFDIYAGKFLILSYHCIL